MKKKRASNREETEHSPGGYVVGQVSGSLFPSKSASDSGSLSALFKTEPSASSLVFIPAPKLVSKAVEVTTLDSTSPSQTFESKKKKKEGKNKSIADKRLESRESALQNADEEDASKSTSRKTKRKAAAVAKMRSDEDDEPAEKKVVSRAEERIKNKRTVFVGNLPIDCTKKVLRDLFKEFGAIESIRFRSVTREDLKMTRKLAAIQRKVTPNRKSINAYVVFKAEDTATNALKRNGMEIEKGFHVRVDLASRATLFHHKQTIFIGNVPYDATELSVRQHFEECGAVEGVRLVRDRNSGVGKGFGYVLFESADAVLLALKLDGSELQGRKIRVKRSVKKEKVKKQALGAGSNPGAGKTGRGQQNPAFKGRPGQGPGSKSTAPFRKNPGKPRRGNSFRGEMAVPASSQQKQKKGLKKKFKPRKAKHVS
uniref:RNA binding motif protein 34 n=1 Tax=Paramormyrops kingsleyae TaxID=1676925 RepID=A0A3B3SA08_9TELE|nr:RNA-binding protein 34 [Paramormyrops kingsleyae]